MKFALLHLSDIHTNNINDSIFDKKSSITDAIKNKLKTVTNLFITVTGDIANRGQAEEYESATKLFEDIKQSLLTYNDKLIIEFIFAPGNHDCDLSEEHFNRNLSIDYILKDKFKNKKVDEQCVKNCVLVQKNYFKFRDNLENLNHINTVLDSELFRRHEYKIGALTVAFNCYNFAWMSKIHEQQSEIYYPGFLIKDELIKVSQKENTLNITLYHHPLHWINHQNLRDLRFLINTTSNLVLSGHEHTQHVHSETDTDTDTTNYIDSAALQTSDRNESHFKLIIINHEEETQCIHDFSWDKNSSKYDEKINNSNLELAVSKSHYEFDDEYLTKINSTGVQMTHPYKSDIYLDDIFIYQNLQTLTQDDLKIKNNASKLKDIESTNKTIIFGEETCGKTSLAYMLQMHYKSSCRLPIYISGKNIKRKDHDEERINKIIEKAFIEQYTNKYLQNFYQEDVNNIIILIDDFSYIDMNKEYTAKFLNKINELFENVIIFSHETSELEVFNDENLAHATKEYDLYKIIEFGHKLRDKLIRQWIVLGQEETITDEKTHEQVVKTAKAITSTIGLNIVPSYPLFLLTLLQAMETNSTADFSESSYGHYYGYLINEAFIKEGVPKNKLNFYHTYLSELAYTCFIGNSHTFDIDDLKQFHNHYNKSHKADKSFDTVLKTLLKTKVIQDTSSSYKFTYDYLYYFYTARYLAKNVNKIEVRTNIEKLVKNSHRIEFGNILMFLIHHSNEAYIINLLLTQTQTVFKELEEFNFSDEQLKKINGSFGHEEKLICEDKSVEEARETKLEKEDDAHKDLVKSDRHDADINEEVDISKLDIFAKVNLAFKLTNILGEIAKSYDDLDGDLKYKLIKESYSLNLRTINVFISKFEENHELLTEAFEELIEKKGYVTQDRIQETAKKVVFSTISRITEGFISRLSKSLASKDLNPIYRELEEEKKGNIAVKMINAAIELDFPKGLKEKAIKHYENLDDNFLAKAVLKRLVVDHMYMYHTDHKIKDKVMAKLDIEKSTSKNMLMKKSFTSKNPN